MLVVDLCCIMLVVVFTYEVFVIWLNCEISMGNSTVIQYGYSSYLKSKTLNVTFKLRKSTFV